jgi:hypothetical protein
MMYHACDECKTGPFCDCGKFKTDSLYKYTSDEDYTTYIKRQTEDWCILNTDGLDYLARLNRAIEQQNVEVNTCSEDIMSFKEWIAMGKTVLLATLLKKK